MKQNTFEVLGYKTKKDFEEFNSQILSDYGLTKSNAKIIATEEIKSNLWYAVKYQSEDREEIEILYKKENNNTVVDSSGITPGQWLVYDNALPLNTMEVCEVYIPGQWIAQVRGDNKETREANARLIAASPDLLEALKNVNKIVEYIERNCAKINETPTR